MFGFGEANIQEIYVTLLIGQVQFLIGCVHAYSSIIISRTAVEETFLKHNVVSWIATSGIILWPVGKFFDLFTVDVLGRKGSLRLMVLLTAMGWAIISVSTNFFIFCLGRALSSFAIGFSAANSLYISETCSTDIQLKLQTITFAFTLLGVVCVNASNYIFSWSFTAFLATLISFLVLLQISFIPETKYWYMLKHRRREAVLSAIWFRNGKTIQQIQEELNKIERAVIRVQGQHSILRIVRSSFVLRRFIFSVLILVTRAGMGYLVFVHYSTSFFHMMGVTYNEEQLTMIFASTCLFFSMCFTCNGIDITKYKVPLCCLTLLMSGLIIIGMVYDHVTWVESRMSESFSSLPSTMIVILFMAINAAVYWPLVNEMLPDVLPSAAQELPAGLCVLIEYIATKVYVIMFPFFERNFGLPFFYCFFLVNSVIALCAIYKSVPEHQPIMVFESLDSFESEQVETSFGEKELLKSLIEDETSS